MRSLQIIHTGCINILLTTYRVCAKLPKEQMNASKDLAVTFVTSLLYCNTNSVFTKTLLFYLDHEWFQCSVSSFSLKVFSFKYISTLPKYLLNSHLINCMVLETTHIRRAFNQQVRAQKLLKVSTVAQHGCFPYLFRLKTLQCKQSRTKGHEIQTLVSHLIPVSCETLALLFKSLQVSFPERNG